MALLLHAMRSPRETRHPSIMFDMVDRARAAVADRAELPGMSLLEHLEELRSRLIRSAISLVVGFFVAYAFHVRIFNLMQAPIVQALKAHHLDPQLVIHNPIDGFNMYLKISFMVAASWRRPTSFTRFGCSFRRDCTHEKRYVTPFMTATVGLFWQAPISDTGRCFPDRWAS